MTIYCPTPVTPIRDPPHHATGPTLPTAECQTSQNNLPLSSHPAQASTSITPDITLTKPRVHNPYTLPQLALNSSDVVRGWGGKRLPSCRAFHQPAHAALIHPRIYHPISISYRGMPAVTHHTHTLLSQWRMISYLDFTPITISFLGHATGAVFRSCLTGKESHAGCM